MNAPSLSTSAAALIIAVSAAPALSESPAPARAPSASGSAQMTADSFVNEAANSGMFETQSSSLAQSKAQNADLKAFAQRMIKDHTDADKKLKAAAGDRKVPTALDPQHANMLQQLQQTSGSNFDQQYAKMQVQGHQKAVNLFETYSKSGDDPKLKQFATATLPTLKDHFQHITQFSDQLSRNPSASTATSNSSTRQASAGAAGAIGSLSAPPAGSMRLTKLHGVDVYNSGNEKIGDINDLILDESGQIKAVVIGVGGFLGLGEHDVAVPFGSLQWTAGAASSSGMETGGSSGAPSRVVLPNATKDKLKSAPQFRYAENPASR